MLDSRPDLRRLAAAAALLFALSSVAAWLRDSRRSAEAQSEPSPPQASTEVRKGPIAVHGDMTRPDPDATVSVYTACRLSPPQDGQTAPWANWAFFDDGRARAESDLEAAPVYAARFATGSVLVVANHSGSDRELRLNVRLPAGVYSIERLALPADLSGTGRIERKRGACLDRPAWVFRPDRIRAGEVAVYRMVNRRAQALSAYRNIKASLQAIRRGRPREFRWLMIPFRECEANLGALSRAGSGRDETRQIRHIERALLTAAHTQTLCRNFRSQGRIPESDGARLEAELNRLDEALAESSAGALLLSPDVRVERPEPDSPKVLDVTVSVSYAGARPLRFIKLGAAASVPAAIQPADERTFRGVRPGQTVTAKFRVRLETAGEDRDVSARVGYLAYRTPVMLRLRPAI